MAEDSFLLVNLKEEKSKKLAQVLSSDTSRKILDFLAARKDATETDVAKELNIPISTAHYNLRQLVKANIVEVDEFHYSAKGKEVNHYKLSNKMIIIMPKHRPGFMEKLKKILPAALLLSAGSLVVYYLQNSTGGVKSALQAVPAAAPEMLQAPGADFAVKSAINIPVQAAPVNVALWIFVGGLAALGLYLGYELVAEKLKK